MPRVADAKYRRITIFSKFTPLDGRDPSREERARERLPSQALEGEEWGQERPGQGLRGKVRERREDKSSVNATIAEKWALSELVLKEEPLGRAPKVVPVGPTEWPPSMPAFGRRNRCPCRSARPLLLLKGAMSSVAASIRRERASAPLDAPRPVEDELSRIMQFLRAIDQGRSSRAREAARGTPRLDPFADITHRAPRRDGTSVVGPPPACT